VSRSGLHSSQIHSKPRATRGVPRTRACARGGTRSRYVPPVELLRSRDRSHVIRATGRPSRLGRNSSVRMRYLFLVAAWCLLSFANSAHAHTSVGGGGSSTDPDADCLRWEAVPISTNDAAVDGGSVDASVDAGDAGPSDAGTTTVAVVLRCAEHATMFGCACALGAGTAQRTEGPAAMLVAAGAVLAIACRPGRRRRRRAGEGRP
jgi:hypothetical protein